MQLERRKEVQEANCKYFESSLERARVDEALDPSKIPNISIVQTPSAAMRASVNEKKVLLGLSGGGAALGLMIAFMIELLFDRSIKRPLELGTRLQVPMLLSIPFFPKLAHSRPFLKKDSRDKDQEGGHALQIATRAKLASWDPGHFIRPFAESIRDRLILSFQLKHLTHKPKLVGLTGLTGGEGTSTLAAGLAAALSETGDGKVLLVNMNPDNSQAHPFFDGRPALGLSDVLQANGSLNPAAENLYLATGTSENGGAMQLAPKRFYDLMPNIKASHFDYVIFDMPPVSRSSATLAIAGCLDALLLVVEAERSDRNETKRAYTEFVNAKAEVSCILNKTRNSGPKWLGN
jgi:Mrp family chromosome partitioning ATPase